VSVVEPSPTRVVGIGASAGGIDALIRLLGTIPRECGCAFCIAVHVPPTGHSVLAQILDRRCAPIVRTAQDGDPIQPGRVYVAPPDRHLTVGIDALRLSCEPAENGVRPAIDPLFRSLAETRGPAAVAVVLSGALGDGAFGARAVAVAGGRVYVQDPTEAIVASMPERAIAAVGPAARVLGVAAIGEEIAQLEPVDIGVLPLAKAPT
jgi:two-component system, chemotaxis family, protein-glutamate methylesterase/glutaminase